MKLLKFFAVFLFIVLLTFITALAGGVQWGTEPAGVLATTGFFIAFIIAAIVVTIP